MKECPQCRTIKSLENFKSSKLITGYGRYCRDCKSGLNTHKNDPKKVRCGTSGENRVKGKSGINYSTILSEALNGRRSVKIHYKGVWRMINPYSLNATYVVAYCHFARDVRTFRIDRIRGAKLSEIFNFDKNLLTTAQSRLVEAPSYKYRYRH